MKLSQERAKEIAGPKFHPILFSTEMVRAILEGRKSETRRICKPQPNPNAEFYRYDVIRQPLFTDNTTIPCRWRKGDGLWVRETWRWPEFLGPEDREYIYRASENGQEWEKSDEGWTWKPSIFMPKEACRIFLQITDIRVERLQDISEGDAIAEGVESYTFSGRMSFTAYKDYLNRQTQSQDDILNAIGSYKSLWQKINGADSWDENPWVWVVSFARIDKPTNF